MQRKNVLWIFLVMLIAAAILGHVSFSVVLTKVSVSPLVVTDVVIGDSFTINVTVADVADLFGYQFLLWYNTTVLTATSYTNLAHLTYSPLNEAAPSAINDTAGWVSVAYSCPPGEAVGLTTTEPKPLAEITFGVDANGTTALNIDENSDYTQFGTIYGDAIMYPENMIISDGIFSNVEEIKLHDIAVTGVDVNATTAEPGDKIAINITLRNNGDYNETFTVAAMYNRTLIAFTGIGTKTVSNLVAGASTSLSFTWDTTGLADDKYIVRAEAVVTGENNPIDNIGDSAIITVGGAGGGLPFNILYVVAIGVVIVIAVVGVYALRARKRT